MFARGLKRAFSIDKEFSLLQQGLAALAGAPEESSERAGQDLPPPPEPHIQEREKRRISRSFRYFLQHYVWIADGGGVKFDPYPWQVDFARELPGLKRVVTLKARQLGISWIVAAYAVWVVMRERGALVLLFSQTKPDALELLEKCQFVFDHLPDWMRPADAIPRTQLLKLPSMRSAIVALPSTRRAGRGRTARVVIGDEHAYHQWAAANFAAVKPTIDAGGQFLSISTADGVGNHFADLCEKAQRVLGWLIPQKRDDGHRGFGQALRKLRKRLRKGAWAAIFFPYDSRPGRDEEWWEQQADEATQPWMVHQEYPRDPEEAFVQTGRPVFRKEHVERQRSLCGDELPEAKWPGPLRGCDPLELRVYAKPVAGHRYVGGADVAEGLEHGDYSNLKVFDVDANGRPKEVLALHGHWEPDEFARMIDQVARLYPGTYGIERNNHGHTVLYECRRIGTPGIFFERPTLNKQGEVVEPGRPGWLTNTVTKPLMIDCLAAALRDLALELSDERALSELILYRKEKDGSTGAPAGRNDDQVMSLAIVVQMFRFIPDSVPEPDGAAVGTFFGDTQDF